MRIQKLAATVALKVLWALLPLHAQISSSAPDDFPRLCAACHGQGANGTERGPALIDNRSLRTRSTNQISDLIRTGKGAMPPFGLSAERLQTLATWIHTLNVSAFEAQPAGDVEAGKQYYFGKGQCSSCHMVAGRGGTNGPDLSAIGRELTLRELNKTLVDPQFRTANRSTASCPEWAWCPDESWAVANLRLRSGSMLRGFARNRGKHDIQLQTLDGRFHFLRDQDFTQVTLEESLMPPLTATDTERQNLLAYLSRLGGIAVGPLTEASAGVSADEMRRVLQPSRGDWPTHNGHVKANRHSELDQIQVQNAGRLRLQWSSSLPYAGLEMTPIVADGVMYVTGPNQVCALDAQTGRQVWCYSRPRTRAGVIAGDAAKGANRGAALLGDRVFFVTDNAHLLCLNRVTGALMWDADMRHQPQHYGSTIAPLVVNDLVIAGVGGADEGIRGFIAAYKVTTGDEQWRFWTVPKLGEPGSDTWSGKAIDLGGGSTWISGSYDSESGLLYWPTGNPFPATDGAERKGDNLYTDSVVALDVKTGKLKWHYQFTPHDLHDWDATEPLVLVDTTFQGRPRKLLLQANRNGFYYVLDRITGEFLLAKPFVRKLNWASGVGADGRPQLLAANEPTAAGIKTCPAVRGATNWYSTAFNPATRLFYVMAVEDCNIYQRSQLGGYTPSRDPSSPPRKYLRALNVETGEIVWEVEQVGAPESNYSGVLSTAGGVLFYGETGGGFAALDAKSGRTLWHFDTNQVWKASPMTYLVNGRQYVAIASGGNILSFALDQ